MSNLYPNSYQVPPMRYANKPSDTMLEQIFSGKDWLAQEKKDGAWYQLEKTMEGEVYLFGRTISKKTGEYTEKINNVPHIKEWAEENLPPGTTLIGEIYVPNGKSNDVTKIMGCTPENAWRRQYEPENFNTYGGPIHYYVFDCIRLYDKDFCNDPYMYRYDHCLKHVLGKALKDQAYIELAQTWDENFEEHLKEIFAAGGEGCVFKKKDSLYKPDKRATVREAFKYKEHLDSIDLICTKLLDPEYYYTGKEADTWPYKDNDGNLITKHAYYGWKNAMQLGAYKNGKIIDVGRVASGFTDEDRQNMAEHPENYLNKVIEVECMSTTKDGALRHPCFKRVREDKGPNDCLWDEIFN